MWLIDVFAPFGHAELALKELRETALAGKSFKMHRTNQDGTRTLLQLTGVGDHDRPRRTSFETDIGFL